jgi:hypothetical protein
MSSPLRYANNNVVERTGVPSEMCFLGLKLYAVQMRTESAIRRPFHLTIVEFFQKIVQIRRNDLRCI